MKFALVKFRVLLLGPRRFVVYTDHASFGTEVQSPHLLEHMAKWRSFFAKYTFDLEYKSGKHSVLADPFLTPGLRAGSYFCVNVGDVRSYPRIICRWRAVLVADCGAVGGGAGWGKVPLTGVARTAAPLHASRWVAAVRSRRWRGTTRGRTCE